MSLQGAKICLFQTSYEAPAIFALLQLVLGSAPSLADLKAAAQGEVLVPVTMTSPRLTVQVHVFSG
jgi:hypothetical protein